MTDNQEGNLDDFIEFIFSGPPRPTGSVQFQGTFQSTPELFEALLMVFTGAMRLRYGNSQGVVDLNTLTPEDLTDIVTRFAAINLRPEITKYHQAQVYGVRHQPLPSPMELHWCETSDTYPELTDLSVIKPYQTVTSDNLADYYFQLINDYNYFVISFHSIQ